MPPHPLILAFDTSTAACDVAVLGAGKVLAHQTEQMSRGQAERLLVLCEEMLAVAGATVGDLTAIGVGIGPGNFTGIRISVAAARGLALGLGIPAVGVSTFEALQLGFDAPCICAVDARRAQAYVQKFSAAGAIGEPALRSFSALDACDLPIIGAGGQDAKYPLSIAIARIATNRHGQDQRRPAPLYLRAADAAPPKDAPPVILK